MAGKDGIERWLQAVMDGQDLDWQALRTQLGDRPELIERLSRTERLVRGFLQANQADGSGRKAWTAASRWGHLKVGELLGRGSHGEVFRAYDSVLEREVALKLRHAETLSVGNFISEARRLARVRHANVLPVHGAAVHEGRAGLWADLIEGESLADWVARCGPRPLRPTLALVRELADALRAVHAAGLVHGDVKPDNVMRDAATGRLVLMDFGSAADRGHAARHGLLGSPASMSIEQLSGRPVGPATDIYGLGVVLHHVSTGRYPVRSTALQDIALEHERGEVQARVAAQPGLAPGVRRLLVRMLATDARQRPGPDQVIAEIDRLLEAPARRRRRMLLATVLASLATALMASVWALWRVGNERDAVVAARAREAVVTSFMRDMLRSPDPAVRGIEVRVVDVLDAAVEDARARFSEQPDLLALALASIGHSQRTLGDHRSAQGALEEALALHRAAIAAGTAVDSGEGCELERQILQARIELEPGAGYVDVLDGLRQRCVEALGPAHRNSLAVALDLADHLRDVDQGEAAVPLAEGVLRLIVPGTEDAAVKTAAAHNLIGWVHAEAGRDGEAGGRFALALEALRTSGNLMHSQAFVARQGLGLAARAQGDLATAEAVIREELVAIEQRFGAGHRFLRIGLTNLGGILQEQGRLHEALALLDRAIELEQRHASSESMDGVTARINRANVLADLGEGTRAGSERRAVLAMARRLGGADHPAALIAAINLAEQHLDEADAGAAQELASEAERRCRERFGADHPFTLAAGVVEARARFARTAGRDGAAALQAACERIVASQGKGDASHRDCLLYLAEARLALGERAAAVAVLRDVQSGSADADAGLARRQARIARLESRYGRLIEP